MSTAPALVNWPQTNSEEDENTLITDYWLSFLSVRQQEEKQEPESPPRDLELQVEEFYRRLNILSRERLTLASGLERVRQGSRSKSEPGPRLFPDETVGPMVTQLHVATDQVPFAEPSRGSLLQRVLRGSGLSLIQKLF